MGSPELISEYPSLPADTIDQIRSHLVCKSRPCIAFFNRLLESNEPLSLGLLFNLSNKWRDFYPIVDDDRAIAYKRKNLGIASAAPTILLLPDAPTAGGKTVLTMAVNSLLWGEETDTPPYSVLIPTIKANHLRPSDKPIAEIRLHDKPQINGVFSGQYVHITEEQMEILKKVKPNPFIETGSFEGRYGTNIKIIEEAINRQPPFLFCVVNSSGQDSIIQWLHKSHSEIPAYKLFIIYSGLNMREQIQRIFYLRPNDDPIERSADAVMDLWFAPHKADFVLENVHGEFTGSVEKLKLLMQIIRE